MVCLQSVIGGDYNMCDKNQYREDGYKPRKSDDLWESSPMNPINRKTRKSRETREMEFIEETMR